MKNVTRELDSQSLKTNFDSVCDTVNDNNEAVTLILKSGRKVIIMPEKSYDSISRFMISGTTFQPL